MTDEERPFILSSDTYKIKPPEMDESIYITIANHEGRPCEIFINSKHMSSFQWISYMTRSISARLQRGESTKQIIKELKDTYDTGGGYIIPKSRGKKANSVVGHIGIVFEEHCKLLSERSKLNIHPQPTSEDQ